MPRFAVVSIVIINFFYVQATGSNYEEYSPIDPDTSSYELLKGDDSQYLGDLDEEDGTISLSISEGVVAVVKNLLIWVASKVAALAFGSVAALALCKLTPICTTLKKKCSSLQEFKSLITPEQLNLALNVLNKAIDRYSSIRKEV